MMAPEEITSRFEREGYAAPLAAIGARDAGKLLAELEEIEGRKGGRIPPAFNAKPHLLLPSLWFVVHDVRIVDAVEAVLGPDLLCYGSSFISKPAGGAAHVSWHQDATHWGLSEPRAVTAWIALTPSDRENGCVRVVPGTHTRPIDHDHPVDPANLLGRKERVLREVAEEEAVDLVLAPGEMSLHHPLLVHGSAPNRSGRRRVGFAVRYIAAQTTLTGGRRGSATHIRGAAGIGFDLEQAPESAMGRPAMMRHAAILRSGMAVIYGD
ncbi:phytanoyl-CoA dioxygenase family protein [Sphingomonas sp. ID0503]|uniref:phytanoyl-CoA dioxygenase family protein n=1 Tax=Sphingomonas sp. ID0503 TaxID=3399691 RepID=UPI003AFA8AA8